MAVTRRDVLKGAGAVAAIQVGAPFVFRGSAWGDVDPATQQRLRLVLVNLGGGNDGLNTVVPYSGQLRAAYDIARINTNIPTSALLPLDKSYDSGRDVSLHNRLGTVHSLYQADRLAIVQGVDYPNHSYSHFVSDDIWQSGIPNGLTDSGWLGRHLDRTGITPGELRACAIGSALPLVLNGGSNDGNVLAGVPITFVDGSSNAAAAVHDAYGRYSLHPATQPLRQYYGGVCKGAVDLVNSMVGLSQPTTNNSLVNAMLAARTLLTANLGVEVVVVGTGGYDTHTNQNVNHPNKLDELDDAIEAFLFGTRDGVAITAGGNPIGPLDPALESRTLIMTFSEFGRRIGDNGDGTDHGAAAPLFLIGPPKTGPHVPVPGSGVPQLVPGLHSDHPQMSSTSHTQALSDNLYQTTDVRAVYQAVLSYWLNQPTDANPDEGDPTFQLNGSNLESNGALAGLFTRA